MHRHIKSRPLPDCVKAPKIGKGRLKQPKWSQFVPKFLLKQFAKPNEMSVQNGSQSERQPLQKLIGTPNHSHYRSGDIWW